MNKVHDLFDIVAFDVPYHRSLIYRSYQNRKELHEVLDKAIEKGANVISIRAVEELE